MDFNLSDEQRMLQENARRFMERDYAFSRRRAIATSGGFEPQVWREFADMGWLAAGIPEAFGGVGFGPVETAILAEEMGRGLLLEPYLHGCLLPAAVLRHCADEAQQAELLPAIGSGEILMAVACSEPESRGDVAWVTTTAQRRGDGYILNGHKSAVVCAAQSDRLLVVARTAGEPASIEGLSLFVLERDTPGMSLETVRLLDGTPAADLRLDNAVVPADALLGREGHAYVGLQRAIDELIVHQCAEIVGGMEDVLALCADYLKIRKQFGVPIGSFQALQHRMADMAIETMQARASLHRGLAMLAGEAPVHERSAQISGCKAQVMRGAKFVTAQGIQLHGGYGLTEEFRVGHHYRRLVLSNAWWGGLEYHLARYTRSIQGIGAAA
ncbi:acyl-CoA dehydrogenase family protein [Pseudomonas sp. NPDC089392]|uniref:acyl-CoA dehydrogenase family protein n=1 Tax=Pseudomonas sp. NPDC089392 TaxID=3364459 RepID=UPI0037F304D5